MGQHTVHRALTRISGLERLALLWLTSTGIIELLAIRFPFWGRLGSFNWVLTLAILSEVAIWLTWWLIRTAWSQRSPWVLLVLGSWLVLIGLAATNPAHIHHEATQEAACFINEGLQQEGWGFRTGCFLGYPLRGYITQGLPSFLLGRTPIALFLGGAWYAWLGLTFAAAGWLKYWLAQQRPQTDLATALALTLPLHAYYFQRFLFGSFEQGYFAVGLGLLLFGSFAWALTKPHSPRIFLTILALQLTIFSYTPTLGMAVIGICLIAWFAWRFRSRVAGVGLVLGLIWLLSSLSFRQDVKLNPIAHTTPLSISGETIGLLNNLVFNYPQPSFFSLPGNLIFWLVILWGISAGRRQRIAVGLTLSLLVLGTIAQGYAYYPQEFRIHRALVILPLLSWMLGDWLSNFKHGRLLITLLIFLLASGVLFHFEYLQTRRLDDRVAFTLWVQPFFATLTTTTLTAWETPEYLDFDSLNDFFTFFLPQSRLMELVPSEMKPKLDCKLPETDFLFLPMNGVCYPKLAANPGLVEKARIYTDTQGKPYALLDLRYTREL